MTESGEKVYEMSSSFNTTLNNPGFGKVTTDRGGDNGGTRVGQFDLAIEF
jgi:hypothetical protein